MKEWDGKSFNGYLHKRMIEQAREIERLEQQLLTAKADGIREAVESCRYPTASMNGGVDIDELLEYAGSMGGRQ